ncbi:MAG TPA: exosortase system-associated protein, TIGR04073 family [Candidatus Acidoferrum sp.]|nr:exosortase system-associated protein, TIGR04073 family [Candidatus Acidoferrum sp.]
MRNIVPFLSAVALAGILGGGCIAAQDKLGRGVKDSMEFARLGEIQRSMEQTALFETPGHHYAEGFIKGFCKSVARTGVGAYEIVTFPLPPYQPVWTSYVNPNDWYLYPDAYKPGLIADSMFSTDVNLGFSGGDVAPFIPGSRFKVFDLH